MCRLRILTRAPVLPLVVLFAALAALGLRRKPGQAGRAAATEPRQAESDGGQPGNDYATAYSEVCRTYHAIDDFRARLLGFLPVVSGAGALVIVNQATDRMPVFLGLFGALVTVGLFLYEVRGIRHCTFLIDQGRGLEDKLRLGTMGQFAHWDRGMLLRPVTLADFPNAALVIYPAVFAGWVYLAFSPLHDVERDWPSSWIGGWDWVPPVVGGVALGLAWLAARRMTQQAADPRLRRSPGTPSRP